MKRFVAAAAAAVSLGYAGAASAAMIAHVISTDEITWTQSPSSMGGTLLGTGATELNFYPSAFGAPVDPLSSVWLPAIFTINGQTTNGNAAASCTPIACAQPGVELTFSFIYSGADTVIGGHTITTGANLLSGTGIIGTLYSSSGGGGPAGLNASSSSAGTFSSDIVGDPTSLYNTFDFFFAGDAFTADPGESASSFTGSLAHGVFRSSVPEPSTWAMMTLGFGLAGAGIRRRSLRRFREVT